MPLAESSSHGTQPPPPLPTGHQLPRRTSAANSVTLRHHRLARDASLRASPGSTPVNNSVVTQSPRRNSSGDSHATGQSDPKKWFDQSNQNPTATFDNNVMDVDPPFFQKESDSSNEEKLYPYPHQAPPPRLVAQSSSADDYRSVIDDLTVEIQKLKEELKRYKQKGPDMLRKDKLFEIKIHGLPKRKKRELETTLRDFAASLQDSPDASSSQRKNASRHATRDHMYSASGSVSKHASSSSGSNFRPVDSAYASMSTGAPSCGTSLGRPPMSARARSSEQKVQSYLRDIPEGLYPRHVAMTDREKKKMVVRRLEQLFTGKIGGRAARRGPLAPVVVAAAVPDIAVAPSEGQPLTRQLVHQPPALPTAEPAREARIDQQPGQQSGLHGKKSGSRDNGSASHSNGDQTESGGNGNCSGSGTNTSPPNMPPPLEQRPTRPKDLDPDRVQVPSENISYIRHLGLVPPELASDSAKGELDVHPDAEGWVYLNLLCNLAQLHIINVTPSFVRSAISEISIKFQLSPDGRKIRWRGGSEGTKFSSDSSRDTSQKSPDTDDTTSSNKGESRKRQKTGNSTGDDFQSGSSSKNPSKFGPQISGSSVSFHYKPLFVQQSSPNGQSSPDDTMSSFGPIEDSNVGGSRWELSGSGTSNRRKRRHDGAIIYYSGAPFCTDLSGDPGDVSPPTYMRLSAQQRQAPPVQFMRPLPHRSASGSSLPYRPLSDAPNLGAASKVVASSHDGAPLPEDYSAAESPGHVDMELGWSSEQQYMEVRPLEPCGLGGVLPDDHFLVVVTTKRPTNESMARLLSASRANADEATECIINRLATMSTSSPAPIKSRSSSLSPVEIEYMSGRIKRLGPVPLPPPAIFFPPFSSDSSSEGGGDLGFDGDDDEYASSEEPISRRANPHKSDGYPDGVDLSSGDEEGEDPDDEPDSRRMYDVDMTEGDGDRTRRSIGSAVAAPGSACEGSRTRTGGSSAATAGGLESGCRSSAEEST